MIFFRNFKGGRLKNRLLKDFYSTFVISAINAVLMIGLSVMLARSMGPENYGIYIFIISIITLLGVPSKAGLPILVVREAAKYYAKKKWSTLGGLLKLTNAFVIGFSILISIVAAGAAWWLWGDEQNVKANVFIWSLLLLPLIAFSNIRDATLRGLGKFMQAQLPNELANPLVMLLLVGSALWLGSEITPILATQYRIAASIVAFGMGVFLLRQVLPKKMFQAKSTYELKKWGISLLSLSSFQGLKTIKGEFIFIIIGFFLSIQDVALYKVAHSVSLTVILGQLIINKMLATEITKLYNSDKIDKLQRVITLSSWSAFVLSLPVIFVLMFWDEKIIEFLFGVEYQKASAALIILALGLLIHISTGPTILLLNMTGHEKQTVKSIVLAIIFNFILCLIFVPLYGLVGAAIATSVSLVVWSLALSWWTYKYTGLKTNIMI